MAPSPIRVDPANVQALLMHTYKFPASRHMLFQFEEAAGARSFLAKLLPKITTAENYGKAQLPDSALNVGLSFAGIQRLDCLSEAALNSFPRDFQVMPNLDLLGDVGPSKNWWNGVPTTDLHALVSVWGQASGAEAGPTVASLAEDVLQTAKATGVKYLEVRPGAEPIEGRRLGSPREVHFGYQDGLSMPPIVWEDPIPEGGVDFRHFLLGYATEASPSWPDPATGGASAESGKFARNGSYLAFRLMYQDVAEFNRFLSQNAPKIAQALNLSTEDAMEWLAAKLMGRWRNGKPLALAPTNPNATVGDMNGFGYTDDPDGLKTPHSSHIRVVNPRQQPIDKLHQPVPLLLRRGMPYGPPLNGTDDDGIDRGMIGMFLCSSLSRQFEKLMTWINQNDFSPVFTDLRAQDPIAGNRHIELASTTYLTPISGGAPLSFEGLNTFIHTKGTAYFLIPGMDGLRQASGG